MHARLCWWTLPAEALCRAGPVYKYDLSIPVAEMYSLVEETRKRMAGLPVEVVGYGHLGDGNLHLNVSCPRYDTDILKHIEPFVYEWTAARKGSISAEHGLGQMKADCIGWASLQNAIVRAHAGFLATGGCRKCTCLCLLESREACRNLWGSVGIQIPSSVWTGVTGRWGVWMVPLMIMPKYCAVQEHQAPACCAFDDSGEAGIRNKRHSQPVQGLAASDGHSSVALP